MNVNAMMLSVGWALCALACGGASAPPEAPASEGERQPPADSASVVEEESQATEASDEPSSRGGESAEPEAQAEPVDKFTYQDALQAVLNDYALIEALHLEKLGRIPLRIAGEIPEGISLYAEQRAVEVVALPEEPGKEPVLVFSKIELSPSAGRFRYRYDAEGIAGTSRVAPGDGKWILKSSRIQNLSR